MPKPASTRPAYKMLTCIYLCRTLLFFAPYADFFVKNTNLFAGVDLIYKHTHLRSLYAYIYANQETGLCAGTVRYLAYSIRKKVGCGCFSLLSGRGKQPFRVSNGVLSYSIDVL